MMPLPHPPHAEDDFAGTEPDALASLTQPHLVAMWPGGAAVAELPSGGTVTVGRSRRAALCIDHPSVSRDHAVFRSMSLGSSGGGTAITVEDLSSTNGTTVAGQRSPGGQRTAVTGHQVVTVGAAVIVVREAFGRPAAGTP